MTDNELDAPPEREPQLGTPGQWMNGVFDALDVAVLVVTPERTFKTVNAAAERMFGYARGELTGQSTAILHVSDERYAAFGTRIREAFDRGESAHFEFEAKRRDGEVFPTEHSVALLRDAAGEEMGLVSIVRDITERRRAEDERHKLEDQLRMSQKMEAIGSLAGGVAHDFNNLLSVILSYTSFAVQQTSAGDPLREDLLEVHKAAERAVGLVRQLLAFSRKQVLQPVTLSLNQVVVEIDKMLRRILGEDIDLVQVLTPDLGVIHADPGQIEQVLMNLVVNARDAMPEGGKLTIETSNVQLDDQYAAAHVGVVPGSYVLLAVTDTGCGMDEQIRARLFEPFFTTKTTGKGTGLGLSTVYGIVKQSRGNIWVYSEPGQGPTFKIYLPCASATATDPASQPAPVAATTQSSETVLVVDDEAALLRVAKRILEAAGYSVLTAAAGEEALRVSAEHSGKIHVLLTDVVMPQMSGRVLAKELTAARPGIKVIYMSGYTDNAIVHHGVLDPGTHFVSKPFTTSQLTRKVRDVLDDDALSA